MLKVEVVRRTSKEVELIGLTTAISEEGVLDDS